MRDLAALRDRLYDLATSELDAIQGDEDVTPKRRVAHATVAGIAASRLLDLAKHLDAIDGLPEDLPRDDDEARHTVLQAMWRRARLGSAAATRDLATKLGVQNARSQGVEVSFADSVTTLLGDEDDAGDGEG